MDGAGKTVVSQVTNNSYKFTSALNGDWIQELHKMHWNSEKKSELPASECTV